MFSGWGSWASFLGGAGAVVIWSKLRDTVFCSLKLWFCWVWSTLIQFVLGPVELVMDRIPDLPDGVVEVGEIAFCVNHWLPLYEFVGYEILFWTIYVAWLIVRLIKSFIPTMAG